MKILVTGGAGFIGSHFVRNVLKHGDIPIVLDNFSTGSLSNIPERVRYYKMDILDNKLEG